MNELSTLQNNKFELCPFTEEFKNTIMEEMKDLGGSLRFQKINIPSGGGLAFEVPGEDESNPDVVKELKGVIVFHHNANARWEGEYTGGEDSSPVCLSNDGTHAINVTGEILSCEGCPYNEYGSGKDGVGKACKNTKRVYMMLSGSVFPVILILPPTSIKSFRDYIQRLLLHVKEPSGVLTSVTLKKETNKSGITYSCCQFRSLGDLNEGEKATIKSAREALKSLVQLEPMKPSEAAEPTAEPKPDDQYIPF